MLATAIAHDGPAAFRFPRGPGQGVRLDAVPHPLELGKARILRDAGPAPDVVVLAAGTVVHAAVRAAEALAGEGIGATVVQQSDTIDFDEELFCQLAATARRVVTVEEGALMGGFGAACLEAFERRGVLPGLQVKRLGLPDAFVTHGDAGKQRAELGLDAAGIAAAARELVGDRAARGVA
jgi:1-deoxy-D-xylulose-5-phosphate synthase